MKLLLDENLPKKLKLDFANHEVYTVKEMAWQGITNGNLLKLMIEFQFEALLTFDKNLQHQQNFSKYTLTVFVLAAEINTYDVLTNLTTKINRLIEKKNLKSGAIIIQA